MTTRKVEILIRDYIVEISCPGGVYAVPVTLGLRDGEVAIEFDYTDIPADDRRWLKSSKGGSHAADLVMRHHHLRNRRCGIISGPYTESVRSNGRGNALGTDQLATEGNRLMTAQTIDQRKAPLPPEAAQYVKVYRLHDGWEIERFIDGWTLSHQAELRSQTGERVFRNLMTTEEFAARKNMPVDELLGQYAGSDGRVDGYLLVTDIEQTFLKDNDCYFPTAEAAFKCWVSFCSTTQGRDHV